MSDSAAVTFPAWSAEAAPCGCTEVRRHNKPNGILFGNKPPDPDCKVCKGSGVIPPKQRVLHVGCGPRKPSQLHWQFQNDGWQEVRLDIDARVEPDIVGSVVSMPSVPDRVFDAVYAAHVLEHLAPHDVAKAFKECLRVLRPGGVMCLRCPDLRQACKAVAEGREFQALYQSPAGPITALDMLFGHRRYVEVLGDCMAHRFGFTEKVLEQAFKEAGFAEWRAWVDLFDLWGEARKGE